MTFRSDLLHFIRNKLHVSVLKGNKINEEEISMSIGVSVIEEYTNNLKDYLSEADKRMYEEKEMVHKLGVKRNG